MTAEQVNHAIAESVVGLTRHMMDVGSLTHGAAYQKVMSTELFKLVSDPDTRLFLEPNAELAQLLDLELSHGSDSVYAAIAR